MKMKATLKCLLLLPLLLLLKDKTRDHICIEFFWNLKWIKKKIQKDFFRFFLKNDEWTKTTTIAKMRNGNIFQVIIHRRLIDGSIR